METPLRRNRNVILTNATKALSNSLMDLLTTTAITSLEERGYVKTIRFGP